MTYFVVVFDTERSELLAFESYSDADSALSARFAHELEHSAESAIEVAVLRAASEKEVRETHPRYFVGARRHASVA